MSAAAVYAVARGRQCGVFYSWTECQESVRGYAGARFKKFASLAAAQQFLIDNGTQNTNGSGSSSAARPLAEEGVEVTGRRARDGQLLEAEMARASSRAAAAPRAAAEQARERIAHHFPAPRSAEAMAGEAGDRKEQAGAAQQRPSVARKRYGHRQRFRFLKKRRRLESDPEATEALAIEADAAQLTGGSW